jgi:hypothetical protein
VVALADAGLITLNWRGKWSSPVRLYPAPGLPSIPVPAHDASPWLTEVLVSDLARQPGRPCQRLLTFSSYTVKAAVARRLAEQRKGVLRASSLQFSPEVLAQTEPAARAAAEVWGTFVEQNQALHNRLRSAFTDNAGGGG